MRIRITGSRLEPTLAEMGLFKQSVCDLAADHFRSRHQRHGDPQQPRRQQDGLHRGRQRADDQLGDLHFAHRPAVDRSVTVQAASLLPNGQLGIVGSRIFAGLMPIGWKVVSVDSEETAGADNAAARAIDGDSSTFWHTRWNADLKLPHSITVDMGTIASDRRVHLSAAPGWNAQRRRRKIPL